MRKSDVEGFKHEGADDSNERRDELIVTIASALRDCQSYGRWEEQNQDSSLDAIRCGAHLQSALDALKR